MKRQSLAVEGSPATGEVRLELARLPGQGTLRLAQAHDDRANSLASVYHGRVCLGAVAVPVVVKLQRATALTGEERSLASAKLDGEYALHGLLQQEKPAGSAPRM